MLNYQTKPYHLQPSSTIIWKIQVSKIIFFSYISPTGCTQQVGLRADFSPPTPPKRNIPTWWCFESQAAPGLYYKELPKQCISFCRFSQCVESWANFVPNTSLMAAPYVATCFSWEYWDTLVKSQTREWILCTRSSGCLIEWAIWHCILISKFKIFQGV